MWTMCCSIWCSNPSRPPGDIQFMTQLQLTHGDIISNVANSALAKFDGRVENYRGLRGKIRGHPCHCTHYWERLLGETPKSRHPCAFHIPQQRPTFDPDQLDLPHISRDLWSSQVFRPGELQCSMWIEVAGGEEKGMGSNCCAPCP